MRSPRVASMLALTASLLGALLLGVLAAGCRAYDPALVEDAGQARPDAGDAGEGRPDAGDAGAPLPAFTLLTLNLHCLSLEGTPYADHEARLAAVAAAVASEEVDAIALQEVCDDGSSDALSILLAALEAAAGGGWSAHRVFAHLANEGTAAEAEEGLAIVARSIRGTGELEHRVQGGLRRVAATAVVGSAFGDLRLMAVHLDHMDAGVREAQAREAAAVSLVEADLAAAPPPASLRLLVAGDLNAREGEPPHLAFLSSGFRDRSAGVGLARIDHIFAHRSAGLAAAEARLLFDAPATAVSDHPGLLVRFVGSTPEAVTVTRVTAEHTPPPGRTLWLRGDTAPLSWEQGWPMHPVAPDRWRWLSTELSGAFLVKAILDDDGVSWQLGEDVPGEAGVDLLLRPAF